MKVEFIGADAVIKGLQSMTSATPKELEWALYQSAQETEREMKANAPRRTGGLQTSINYDIDGRGLTAEIGVDDSYYDGRPVGRSVEFGRPGNSTPPPAIALMVRYGLSAAAAKKAAKTIGERGTQGKFFVLKTFEGIQDRVASVGLQAMYKITNYF